MKRPKISEAISPLTKSRHSAETPAAAFAATATKHDLYIALVLRVRDRVFQRIVASILNYGGPNAPASISSISTPPNQRYEYRRSA
jgi:hypothetical protein